MSADPGDTSRSTTREVRAVVFDLGGVLIDWDPRHLYRRLLRGDEAAVERFLSEVCTPEWNEEQDGGRSFAEGIAQLQARHPEHAELVAAYRDCWEEMIPGSLEGGPELLAEVKRAGLPVYALSNWSAETYPIAERRFGFLSWFNGVVISGRVGLRKPDPAIYRHLLDTHTLDASSTLFIDDSERNVRAARAVGLAALHFRGMGQLRSRLCALHVLPPAGGWRARATSRPRSRS